MHDHFVPFDWVSDNLPDVTSGVVGRSFAGGFRRPVINPATGRAWIHALDASEDDALHAVSVADGWLDPWREDPAVRLEGLERWSALIGTHREWLAQVLTREQGKPIVEARTEIDYARSFVDQAVALLPRLVTSRRLSLADGSIEAEVSWQPLGVSVAVTPWNFPAAMVTRKLAFGWAAGCPMIVKPSEWTPCTAVALMRMALEAGIPPEAAQWILGDGSVFLPLWMQHPGVRKVSLTGSTRVGKILMDQASVTLKRLALELGGDAPWMMFDDADPMEAASLLYAAKMRNMGQSCTAANRLFVTRRRHDALLEALVSHARSVVRIGDGADESTTVGPLTLTSASRRLGSWLDRAHEGGARVVESWDLPLGCNSGYFFPPCIVTEVDGTMDLGCQEIFGPIFAIQPCEDEADMMKRALQTQHGLAAYAVGQDPDRLAPFLARAEVGMLGWNQSRISHAEIPFGGWRSSGVGREGGIEGLLAFCDTRTVIRSSQVACFNGPKDNIRS